MGKRFRFFAVDDCTKEQNSPLVSSGSKEHHQNTQEAEGTQSLADALNVWDWQVLAGPKPKANQSDAEWAASPSPPESSTSTLTPCLSPHSHLPLTPMLAFYWVLHPTVPFSCPGTRVSLHLFVLLLLCSPHSRIPGCCPSYLTPSPLPASLY